MNRAKAVFLDRDGTLIEEVDYLSRTEDLRVFEFTVPALLNLKEAGFLNIIVTNQSGVSRGYLTEKDLHGIHDELKKRIQHDGMPLIDDIYYSPYHTEGIIEEYRKVSEDRKPGIGMIVRAAEAHNIDLKESYLIGDSLTDMQCAAKAGLRKILVATGYGENCRTDCTGTEWEPDFFASNLLEASEYILEQEKKKEIISHN